jgi:tRNA threonylcarbamoyladenosine biosynthesis protein TsaB
MLVLAFDTATTTATVALVRDGVALGERTTTARALLRDAEALMRQAELRPHDVEGIAVGTGPGSYTSLRMGLVTARVLSLALSAPVAGVPTLQALAAGAPGALPLIDARRHEVFTLAPEPACMAATALQVETGRVYIGDGAVRYRELLEAAGAVVPADDDPRHVPWARHHARLAADFGPAELAEPLYLRAPDAERALQRSPA